MEKKEYKIFISLPFTGVEDTLGERFDDAVNYLNNYQKEHEDLEVKMYAQKNIAELIEYKKSVDDSLYPYYMGKDIQSVLECDAILMCEGWENSKGCQLEHKAAELFGVEIIYKK